MFQANGGVQSHPGISSKMGPFLVVELKPMVTLGSPMILETSELDQQQT